MFADISLMKVSEMVSQYSLEYSHTPIEFYIVIAVACICTLLCWHFRVFKYSGWLMVGLTIGLVVILGTHQCLVENQRKQAVVDAINQLGRKQKLFAVDTASGTYVFDKSQVDQYRNGSHQYVPLNDKSYDIDDNSDDDWTTSPVWSVNRHYKKSINLSASTFGQLRSLSAREYFLQVINQTAW